MATQIHNASPSLLLKCSRSSRMVEWSSSKMSIGQHQRHRSVGATRSLRLSPSVSSGLWNRQSPRHQAPQPQQRSLQEYHHHQQQQQQQHGFMMSRRYYSNTSMLNYRIAIVGSGPSGCYTAKYIQTALEKQEKKKQEKDNRDDDASSSSSSALTIDILDRLPTIGGLVRYGVAPDHPEVKNVLNDFEALFRTTCTTDKNDQNSNNNNANANVAFYGNVHVGQDVSLHELRSLYDAVVLAYGCESDRKLGIPGEDSITDGVLSAREFVAWYNGHPDYVHVGEHVAKALGVDIMTSSTNNNTIRQASVVIIGQGNVALDCARVLAKGCGTSSTDENVDEAKSMRLYDTDLAAHALPVIGDGISNVTIVGRRGSVQGAFTIKEIRELVKLEQEGYGAAFHVDMNELDLGLTDATQQELSAKATGRPKQRIDKLLRDTASKDHSGIMPKNVYLRFLLNPVRFEPNASDQTKLGAVVCERTKLEGQPGQQRAVGTGEEHTFPADLALVSIGYKGIQIPGLEPWFDEQRGIVTNENGRVDSPTASSDGRLGGLYTSGWLKRGPSGIIGTNIPDAKDTVATIVNDLCADNYQKIKTSPSTLKDLLTSRNVKFVDWDGYQRIVAKESEIRRSELQPREKITDWKQQIEVATQS